MRQIDAGMLLEVDGDVKKRYLVVREYELVSLNKREVINASAGVGNGEEVNAQGFDVQQGGELLQRGSIHLLRFFAG